MTENRKCQHVYTKPAVRKAKSYVDVVGGIDDVEHLQAADAAQGSEVTQAAVVPGNRGVAQLHTAAAAASHTTVRERNKEGRKEMFYLTMHSTHFIYGFVASHIW